MTGFAEIAASSLLIRPYIPEPLIGQYDAIVGFALKHAVIPQLEEVDAVDFRPLAEVVELHGWSRGVDGAA